jgi:hypothetical protein
MSSSTANTSIARSAARLRWAVFAAMAVAVFLYAAARFGLQFGEMRIEYHGQGADPASARTIADASMLLLLVALFRLTQMLGRIAAGELFSAGVIGRFRSFAFWLMLAALFRLFAPAASALLGVAQGGRGLEIRIDFRDVLTVGVTLVLFLLARLLERARRLEEEIREFV